MPRRKRIAPTTRTRARELRKPLTPAEQKLWPHLRDGRLHGHKFRRQHPIGRFIADFCCVESKLIVEIDGESHIESEAHDAERTSMLERAGFRIIRFWNTDVCSNLDGVLETILSDCEAEQG